MAKLTPLPDFRLLSIPGRANHWRDVRCAFPRPAATLKPPRPKPPTWNEEDLRRLDALLERVRSEAERVCSELRQQAEFDALTPRQQARAFSAAIGDTPLAPLLHLARRGELSAELARLILKDASLLV